MTVFVAVDIIVKSLGFVESVVAAGDASEVARRATIGRVEQRNNNTQPWENRQNI